MLKGVYRPETTWQQFFRRLDPLEPYCRIEGHTSEEVREILAALEKVYREALPHLNLRRWTSSIYTWLTQAVLDPSNSGRVTMNYLMKLVKTALEWSYEAKSTDVEVEMLEKAATLLVLRRETLWIIDGAGPSIEALQTPAEKGEIGDKTERETKPEQETVSTNGQQNATELRETVENPVQTGKTPTCTFPGLVEISLKRFQESDTQLVECPGCGRMRTLTPSKGVLRFKAHTPRKQQTPLTAKRWSTTGKTDWDVVGGERPTVPSME
jgi:hypothetical protein